jgi:hypothetical protein
MEYHVNKDSAVAIRIFELGFKLFSEDVDYVVRYLQFLLYVNDDTSEHLHTSFKNQKLNMQMPEPYSSDLR